MKRYVHSVGYAVSGLRHALATERNFPLFTVGYVCTLIACFFFRLDFGEIPVVILSGGTFLSIELLNTALERFADAFDAHARKQDDLYHQAIKCTKDVAAAAALISAFVWALTVFMVFWPHVLLLLERLK